MLVELSIRNLAVVEAVQVSFSQGFHVLTGETGAGKSIIIDALGLIAGSRSSAEWVRHGCDKAVIEAMFYLSPGHPVWNVVSDIGIEPEQDEVLIIRREVTSLGKSSSRINGQLVNLTALKEVGERLINIHGQHEHQSLLKAEQHLQWLDAYGEEEIGAVKTKYRSTFLSYTKTVKELAELQETSKQALHMLDLYRFQVEEITAAKLIPGEDESLAEEKHKLSNGEKIVQAVTVGYENMYGSNRGLDMIGKAISKIQEISEYDPSVLKPLLEQMQSAYYQLEDAAFQLRDYREQVEFNPDRLEQIEQRLNLISSFRRKYGESVSEILQYVDKIHNEMSLIERKDDIINELKQKAAQQFKELVGLAKQLSNIRKSIAQRLSRQIESELKDLQMERTRLEVQLQRLEDPRGWDVDGLPVRFTKDGWDTAQFLISPNPGEPLRSLHKIASGGELSRIMLAMKSVFAQVDRIPVLIFDEVDTGVSGRAAQSIAEKLSYLSRYCQVFSITHLPQVACMADLHYEIKKQVKEGRTSTKVINLDHPGRMHELARMLGGVEVTETTLQHAEEMLVLADEKKSSCVLGNPDKL